jgi:hypothetical protein
MKGASVGIITYGSTEPAVDEARHQLNKDHDLPTDFLRVRAIPFTNEVRKFIEKHPVNYVVEMNRDGQLHQLLTLEYPEFSTRLVSVAHGDGMPASARWVRQGILAKRTPSHGNGKARGPKTVAKASPGARESQVASISRKKVPANRARPARRAKTATGK